MTVVYAVINDKCCIMSFGKGEIIDQSHIGDAVLPDVSFSRDLGIISHDLSPSAHIYQ